MFLIIKIVLLGTWAAAKQMEKRAFDDAESELNTEVDWSAGRKRKALSVFSSANQSSSTAQRSSLSSGIFKLRDPINVSDDDDEDLVPVSQILHHLNGSTVPYPVKTSQQSGAPARQAAASSQQSSAAPARQAVAFSQQPPAAPARQAVASSQQALDATRQTSAPTEQASTSSKPKQLETPSIFEGIEGFEGFDSSSKLFFNTHP